MFDLCRCLHSFPKRKSTQKSISISPTRVELRKRLPLSFLETMLIEVSWPFRLWVYLCLWKLLHLKMLLCLEEIISPESWPNCIILSYNAIKNMDSNSSKCLWMHLTLYLLLALLIKITSVYMGESVIKLKRYYFF